MPTPDPDCARSRAMTLPDGFIEAERDAAIEALAGSLQREAQYNETPFLTLPGVKVAVRLMACQKLGIESSEVPDP